MPPNLQEVKLKFTRRRSAKVMGSLANQDEEPKEGQPVLVPGDMGTASWVLSGPESGGNDAFSSSCHGAGRKLSRTAARNQINSSELKLQLEQNGINVHTKTPNVLSEEAPDAYKDVDEVIRLTCEAGLARPVARMKPFAVIKG